MVLNLNRIMRVRRATVLNVTTGALGSTCQVLESVKLSTRQAEVPCEPNLISPDLTSLICCSRLASKKEYKFLVFKCVNSRNE